MAYDESLADRIRAAVARLEGVSEKRMFGGLAFLLDGKMFCGIVGDKLMARIGPERYEEALGEQHVEPMDFTGRPMMGYVFVGAAACATVAAARRWVERSAAFVATVTPARKHGRS